MDEVSPDELSLSVSHSPSSSLSSLLSSVLSLLSSVSSLSHSSSLSSSPSVVPFDGNAENGADVIVPEDQDVLVPFDVHSVGAGDEVSFFYMVL